MIFGKNKKGGDKLHPFRINLTDSDQFRESIPLTVQRHVSHILGHTGTDDLLTQLCADLQ